MAQKDALHKLIGTAIEEDVGAGDITTTGALTGGETGIARAVAQSDTVIAGIDVFKETFLFMDPDIKFTAYTDDGMTVKRGDVIAEVRGRLAAILMAERTALNFFQRMCGIATMTRRLVDAVKDTDAKIIHTRKTAPGLRILDTYAVRAGGGYSHRFGLFDGALIKENHIAAAGSIAAAVKNVRRRIPITVKIEVEVENLKEVEEALQAGADVIMFDNMSIEEMKEAVKLVGGRVPLEASGNVTLANVKDVAATGVNYISSGLLTHSVAATDVSLRVESPVR
ncbi:MAG: carboxylating nicotinate-nucleotide diphosphorylase [Syntrophales bacterium]|nr:carboxylating nicotinate-nucleotide diphosphorylase [Syntrophales bacterium]